MTEPAVGGKVLDASAVAALVHGRISALSWLEVARTSGIVLYLPSLALVEVRSVRPDSGPVLAELVGHAQVVLGEPDAAAAADVDRLLADAGDGVFDALAGYVVHIARRRGWPVLTADPARLRRLDDALDLDLL